MMAIDAVWFCPVETAELVKLRRNSILECSDQSRMKYRLGKAVTRQIPGQFRLAFGESRGAHRCRERCSQVEVQAGVDSSFLGYRRCPFRVLHENHGTHRGHCYTKTEFEGFFGVLTVPPPIIIVNDEAAGPIRVPAPRCRLADLPGPA